MSRVEEGKLDLRVTPALRMKLKQHAEKLDCTEAEVIRRAIQFYLADDWLGVVVRLVQVILFEVLFIRTMLTAYVSVTTEKEYVRKRKPIWIKVSKRRLRKVMDQIEWDKSLKERGVSELAELDSEELPWDEVDV